MYLKVTYFLFIIFFVISPLFTLAASGDVVINEIMTGQTESTKNEFIELYNTTADDINLDGYKLKKKTKSGTESNLVSSSRFTGTIPAYGYFLITHPDYVDTISADLSYSGSSYSIASNNTIILYDTDDNIIDKVGYGNAFDFENQATTDPEKDQSIERQSAGYDTDNNSTDFVVQNTPNPRNSGDSSSQQTSASNDASTTSSSDSSNYPPFAIAGSNITALTNQEIPFDGSESYDRSNDPLTYFWNFGDGATDIEKKTTHTYAYPGQYLVTLMVSDGVYESLDIITVNIYSQSVIISEFSKDWIELYNQSNEVANLTDWQLVNSSSTFFIFPPNTLIGPKQFLVFRKEITKMEFNDNQISLIYPDGSIGIEVNYSTNNKENFCIAFNGSDYFWTNIATPGTSNIISTQPNIPKNFSVNNPKTVTQQINNLTQKENFNTQNQATTSNNSITQSAQETLPDNFQETQSASIFQTQQNKRSNLITYIILIISASLIISWIIIRTRKKYNNVIG